MRTCPIHTPPGGPPQGHAPQLYTLIGQEGLFRLAAGFYQRLGGSAIAHLFPEDLEAASRKQAAFLCGVLGGPPLYREIYGPPRMRARHLPFEIDEAARQEWLRCFRETLGDGSEWGLDPRQRQALWQWLESFSAWMVNVEPS